MKIGGEHDNGVGQDVSRIGAGEDLCESDGGGGGRRSGGGGGGGGGGGRRREFSHRTDRDDVLAPRFNDCRRAFPAFT